MWFRQLIREETGCASYMVACGRSGECAVFDPVWEIEPVLREARKQGFRIVFAIDSHAHADHVSGARRLAKATGAELMVPERMTAEYEATRLQDGQIVELGEVSLEVLHVPGHRPEQINLIVRDRSRGEEPWCVLTADGLLVGDLARPDLAQDGRDGAAALFQQTVPRYLKLPDFTEVYPGHVAGST